MATLYFNNAVDHDWYTLGNWWTNEACTVQATALPNVPYNTAPTDLPVVTEGSILDDTPRREISPIADITNNGTIGYIEQGWLFANSATGVVRDHDSASYCPDNFGKIFIEYSSPPDNHGWIGLISHPDGMQANHGTVVTASRSGDVGPVAMLYQLSAKVRVACTLSGSGNWADLSTWLSDPDYISLPPFVPAYATNGYRAYIPAGMTIDEIPEGEICVENLGTVTTNNGTITLNGEDGVVTTNAEDGVVTTNDGEVTNNDGTVRINN